MRALRDKRDVSQSAFFASLGSSLDADPPRHYEVDPLAKGALQEDELPFAEAPLHGLRRNLPNLQRAQLRTIGNPPQKLRIN